MDFYFLPLISEGTNVKHPDLYSKASSGKYALDPGFISKLLMVILCLALITWSGCTKRFFVQSV